MATTGLYIHKSLTIIAKNRLVHTWILHRFHQDFPDWITQDNTRIFWIYQNHQSRKTVATLLTCLYLSGETQSTTTCGFPHTGKVP